jgi:hypothetical protein
MEARWIATVVLPSAGFALEIAMSFDGFPVVVWSNEDDKSRNASENCEEELS